MSSRLEQIFEKQKELMDKYHKIETSNGVGYGLLQGKKFNINEMRSQELVRSMAWRIVEELVESDTAARVSHFKEELADVLHFLVELCIVIGINNEDIMADIIYINDEYDDLDMLFNIHISFLPECHAYGIIRNLGLAVNCLKNKAWKIKHTDVDIDKFNKYIIYTIKEFFNYVSNIFNSSEDLFDHYFKKSKTNDIRIKENY